MSEQSSQPATQPAPAPKPAEQTSDQERGPAGVPAEDIEFETDEEAGTVGTKVGGVGWPEGAENEQPDEAKDAGS